MSDLKDERRKLQKELAEVDRKLEEEAKDSLASLDDLKSEIVRLAKLYNEQAKQKDLDVGIGVIYGNGTKGSEDDYYDNNCDYLVKARGEAFWFPSTMVC